MNIRTTSAVVALCAAQAASACSLDLSREISFPKDSMALQADQVRRLVNWYVDLRDSSIGISEVSIYAYAVKGDPTHVKTVGERVAGVSQLVQILGAGAPVPLSAKVSEGEADRAEQFPEVIVAVQPKCAQTRSCCSAPGLK
jgi:hypothetical protein